MIGRQVLDRARKHLLGAAAGGNETDADFHLAHVRLGCRLNAVAVNRDLAAAAERHARRRDDHRHVGEAKRLRRALEAANHQIDLVPVAFLRLEQQKHQVRADRKVRRVVADHERREVRRGFLDAREQHLARVGADRVHLRVELDRQHAVAEVDEARAGILADDLLAVLCRLEKLQIWIAGLNAALKGRRHIREPRHIRSPNRLRDFERTELPPEAPLHRAVHIVGRVRDVGRNTLRVLDCRPEGRAQKRANLVVRVGERSNPLADVGKYLPHTVSASNYGNFEDEKEVDLYNRMLRELDKSKQKEMLLQFAKYVLDEQAHGIYLLWWQRIVPYQSYVKGWKIGPSHYVNQDLATVWLDK